MAASDDLRFNCSVENEVARNATKDFAGMLGKAFEQYKKLWNEYLLLRKYCEDVDVKIPFQVLESESYQNKNINALSKISSSRIELCSEHQSQESQSTKVSNSTYESALNVYSPDLTPDFDNTLSSQGQIRNNELLKSPVLVRGRKSKRSNVTHSPYILDDSDENMCLPMKQNISISVNNCEWNSMETSVDSTGNERSAIENDDRIECTPISKVPRKLAVSKLYNVDTTLLRSGKKSRQSKLVFLPSTQKTDDAANTSYKAKLLRPHTSPTSLKNREGTLKNRIKSTDEEIIESSPKKHMKSSFKVHSLTLKRKGLLRSLQKNNVSSKISDVKMPLTEINEASASQYLPYIKKEELCSIERSKTVGSLRDRSIESNCDSPDPFSPVVIKTEDIFFADTESDSNLSTPVKRTKKIKVTEDNHETQTRKPLESASQMLNCDSSTYNDETYCVLGEKLKENSACNMGEIKKDVRESNMLPPSLSAKKSLMSSFDIPPDKKDLSGYKSSKSKSERAKMNGIDCWECQQYYSNLGLSEMEIKARQNQCSRHRTKDIERQCTPDGFWDHLFPETFSSTFQDD